MPVISPSTLSLPLSLRPPGPPRKHLRGSLAEHYKEVETGTLPVEVVVESARETHFRNDPDTILVAVLNCPQNADARLGPGVKVKTSDMLVRIRDSLTGQRYWVPSQVVGEIVEAADVEKGTIVWMLSNDAPEWVPTVYVRTPRHLCELDGVDGHDYITRQCKLEREHRRGSQSQSGVKFSSSEPSLASAIVSRRDHRAVIHNQGRHQLEPKTRGEFYSPHDARPQSLEPPFSPLFEYQLDQVCSYDCVECESELEGRVGSYSSYDTELQSPDHRLTPSPDIRVPNNPQQIIHPRSSNPELPEIPESPETFNSFLSFSPLPSDHVQLSFPRRMRSAFTLPIVRAPTTNSAPVQTQQNVSRWKAIRSSTFNFIFRHRR